MMTAPPSFAPVAPVAELLGDLRALAEHLGHPADAAATPLPLSLAAVNSPARLRQFLGNFGRQILASREWPLIVRSHDLARRGMARELVALDLEWTATASTLGFAEASFRVGRRQLSRLRPLKDQRVIGKYLAAVEAGEAWGWHPVVYGLVLAVFNLPLRQGLMNYATQTLGGFTDAAVLAHRLNEAECAAVLAEFAGTLPAALPPLPDTALFLA